MTDRHGQYLMPGVVLPPPLDAPPPPPPPSSGNRPRGRIIAYIHRAPDGTDTWFDPAEILIVREGAE